MRSTRLRKFRKKHQWLMISLKTVLIFYIVLYSASYFTTNTVAYFDDKNVSNIMIAAGTWEDEEKDEEKDEEEREEGEKDSVHDEVEEDMSSLAFIPQGDMTQANCLIEVQVINNGEGPMLSEDYYEVYYSEEGDPKSEGESILLNEDEGIIPVLTKEEEVTITFEPSKNGMYRFVLYGSEDTPEEEWIWSDVFEVNCHEEVEETNEEVQSEQPTNEADEPKDDTDEENVGDVGEQAKEPVREEDEDIPVGEDEKGVDGDEKEENNEVDE